jgi:hypothetical protein
MQSFQDFSSWPPDQERHFAVFEQRTVEASKKAWAIGIFAGVAFGIAMIGIAVAFKPAESRSKAAASENPDLTQENIAPAAATAPSAADPSAAPPAPSGAAPAAGGTTDPAAAPAGSAPADPAAAPAGSAPTDPAAPAGSAPADPSAPAGGATGGAAPAGAAPGDGQGSSGGAAITPPTPAPGTTKAPPTALVKDQK